MSEIQRAIVADHIAELEREGAAIRAERARDHAREYAAIQTDATGHRIELVPSRRIRLGRWLVAVGEAIAGTSRSAGDSVGRALATDNGPCDDGPDRLAP
ncbi:MAG: hypothetical protein H0V73_09475, partial [Chloroflexi bacterium]|nr:hypothetical protein [Chloroflexota bacterium]